MMSLGGALIGLVVASGDSSNGFSAYGPLLVAAAAIVTALIAARSRSDKRVVDTTMGWDAQANTAIHGLSEAYDRVEAERARCSARADELEDELSECNAAVRECEAEKARLLEDIVRLRGAGGTEGHGTP